VSLLERIQGPRDLKNLAADELPQLAAEIRDNLIRTVTTNGGHLGPNLGVVELTIALHRVFDSPVDRIVFDTGHQSYVHKLLTGRLPEFGTLRQRGGLTGYPNRSESEHDLVENSHASTSLSYADGLAKAYQLRGETHRRVIAIIGDGALTGGMAWEALNNIAGAKDRSVVVVVNDNGRSYQPTIGGLADHLATVRVTQRYEQVLDYIKTSLSHTPLVGVPLYDTLHGIKKGLKDVLQPQVLFEDLGLKYLGPVDGHDEHMVEHALRRARDFGGPVLVHVITRKGFGYPLAEENEEDCLHQVSPAARPAAAKSGSANSGAAKSGSAKSGSAQPAVAKPAAADPAAGPAAPRQLTQVFGEELTAIGAERPDVVAITAAMLHPTGLAKFAATFPDRVFDVGIAEQHAVTSSAGLAMGGMHPVAAIYATFLNRAFDQVLMDVALHRLPVTFALDRAGVTGPDGASHHGMWDGSILQLVPGLRIAVPRDGTRLAELLREAVAISDGPTALRYPGRLAAPDVPAVGKIGEMDVLRLPADPGRKDVLLFGAGPMASVCVEVADRLADHGIEVTVVDPRWVKPLDPALPAAAREYGLVATVEDNGRVGGFGDAVARMLRDSDVDTPVRTFGLEQSFLDHGERGQVLDAQGLTAQHLARQLTELVARRAQQPASATQPSATQPRASQTSASQTSATRASATQASATQAAARQPSEDQPA
jgi:1-deoxy-D-xylulose-5-phosphate synthase